MLHRAYNELSDNFQTNIDKKIALDGTPYTFDEENPKQDAISTVTGHAMIYALTEVMQKWPSTYRTKTRPRRVFSHVKMSQRSRLVFHDIEKVKVDSGSWRLEASSRCYMHTFDLFSFPADSFLSAILTGSPLSRKYDMETDTFYIGVICFGTSRTGDRGSQT